MNLRILRISDVAKELQTDKFKMMIYRQIEKFVYKYHTHYYPHYKGELKDLIVDIFTKFCEPKKHRNGEVFSELDRVEPSKVGGGQWTGDEDKAIATYVQRYVIARLIDMERTDKREVSISENYDEKNPGLTVDRALSGGKKRSGSGDDGMVDGGYVENITYKFYDLMDNPQAIANAKRTLLNNPEQVKRIKFLAKHYNDKLDPQVKEFITKLLGEEEIPMEKSSKVEETVKSVLGDNVKVSNYTLQNKPAIKVSFTDKETMQNATEHKEKVIADLKEDGYEFYKAHGSNWYFFKASKVGDSVSGPKSGQRFKCIKDVPNPSGYGIFCKEGDIVSCAEDGYLVNSDEQVYEPYKYSMHEYFELDEVDDSLIEDDRKMEDSRDWSKGDYTREINAVKEYYKTAEDGRFKSFVDRKGFEKFTPEDWRKAFKYMQKDEEAHGKLPTIFNHPEYTTE